MPAVNEGLNPDSSQVLSSPPTGEKSKAFQRPDVVGTAGVIRGPSSLRKGVAPQGFGQMAACQPLDVVGAAGWGHGPTIGNSSGASLHSDLAPQTVGQTVLREAWREGTAVGDPLRYAENLMLFYHMQHVRDSRREKERQRRARMSDALARLRTVIPGLNKKTDNATASECAVAFVQHAQRALLATCGPDGLRQVKQDFIDKFQLWETVQELPD